MMRKKSQEEQNKEDKLDKKEKLNIKKLKL